MSGITGGPWKGHMLDSRIVYTPWFGFTAYNTRNHTPGITFWRLKNLSPGVVFCGVCDILCSPGDKSAAVGAVEGVCDN